MEQDILFRVAKKVLTFAGLLLILFLMTSEQIRY